MKIFGVALLCAWAAFLIEAVISLAWGSQFGRHAALMAGATLCTGGLAMGLFGVSNVITGEMLCRGVTVNRWDRPISFWLITVLWGLAALVAFSAGVDQAALWLRQLYLPH